MGDFREQSWGNAKKPIRVIGEEGQAMKYLFLVASRNALVCVKSS